MNPEGALDPQTSPNDAIPTSWKCPSISHCRGEPLSSCNDERSFCVTDLPQIYGTGKSLLLSQLGQLEFHLTITLMRYQLLCSKETKGREFHFQDRHFLTEHINRAIAITNH